MAPMKRMKNCIGILATALKSRERRLYAHQDGVEVQGETALGDRFSGEIALHLGLIAAEVGEEEKRAADEAAPDIEAVVPIEVGGDGVEASGGARQKDRVAERDRGGKQLDHGDQRDHQA